MTVKELLINVLDPILAREGYSVYFAAVKIQLRRRLQNPDREKRAKIKPAQYQRLYNIQQGKCPDCGDQLLIPAKRNHADHKDPNRQDLNHFSNFQLLHPKCNLEKSAMTIQEQSKAGHGTFHQIIRTPSEEEV